MSVRDSWDHQRCKEHLTGYFQDHYFEPIDEPSAGNGYIDIHIKKESGDLRPALFIEITTAGDAQTTDMDKILDICWEKFTERKYTEEDKHGLFIAFAWDRRFCKIGIRRYGDFLTE